MPFVANHQVKVGRLQDIRNQTHLLIANNHDRIDTTDEEVLHVAFAVDGKDTQSFFAEPFVEFFGPVGDEGGGADNESASGDRSFAGIWMGSVSYSNTNPVSHRKVTHP